MRGEVVVDFLPEAAQRYGRGWAVVAVDVIRATTTAVTAAWRGFQVFPAHDLADARALAGQLADPLLVGELGGVVPPDFEETNSPAAMDLRADVGRPVVLLSTSGTRLLRADDRREATYAACLRNATAQAAWLTGRHQRIALVGAGGRGEFREEDQYGCARLALPLLDAGYRPVGMTSEVVDRWRGLPPSAFANGKSAGFLRRTGQLADLDFVLSHDDDVAAVFPLAGRQLSCVSATSTSQPADDVEVVA